MAYPLLLSPIDASGEPTVWAYQDLQFWEGAQQAWVVDPSANSQLGPTRSVFRTKWGDLYRWDAYVAFPYEMSIGYRRARLFYWGTDGRWNPYKIVESRR